MPNSIYMIRNMKIFLAGGIPFGILIGTLNTYRYGLQPGLISGLIAGLAFGLIMYIIIGFLHSREVNKIGDGKFRSETGVHHFRSIQFQAPYDQVFDLCVESLRLIKNCKIKEDNRLTGKIIARAGLNWKTWSDTITFLINREHDGCTHIELSSRPTARTTIVDFGKNLENVETIIIFLRHSLELH